MGFLRGIWDWAGLVDDIRGRVTVLWWTFVLLAGAAFFVASVVPHSAAVALYVLGGICVAVGVLGAIGHFGGTDTPDALESEREARSVPAIAVYLPDTPCERYRDAGGGDTIWCHLVVEALSDQVLRRCHARLIGVEQAIERRWVRDSRFAAPIRLKWAFAGLDHPEVEYRDIRPGEPTLLDVVFTLERAPGRAFIAALDAQPIGLPRDLGPGVYLATVRVLADDHDPVDFTVMLTVSDAWQVSMGAHVGARDR